MIQKHFERKTYTHKGIGVVVQIDYDHETVSLTDSSGGIKRYVFSGRHLDYMEGWQNIFDALKYAVKEATKDLQAHVEALNTEQAELTLRVDKQLRKEHGKKK